jgi:hypothetical protein
MFPGFRRRRRVAIRRRPCPTSEDHEELAGHIQVFLAEKHFEGCGGIGTINAPV